MKFMLALIMATAASSYAYADEVIYDVEPNHTFVHFDVVHSNTSTNRGRFDNIDGNITINTEKRTGTADINIYIDSINTGIPPYNEHLLGEDFLKAKEFPKATFNGDNFVFEGDKLKSVGGNLTLLGVSKPVVLEAERFNCYNRNNKDICGGDFETEINRSEFGMNYGLPGIPDKVEILIQIEAIKR